MKFTKEIIGSKESLSRMNIIAFRLTHMLDFQSCKKLRLDVHIKLALELTLQTLSNNIRFSRELLLDQEINA